MFKKYIKKSSLNRKNSRLVKSGKSEISGNKLGWWNRDESFSEQDNTLTSIVISSEYHHRPDLLAYYYYGSTEFEWAILQYNLIVDINEDFVTGKTIKIPTPEFVNSFSTKIKR